MIQTVSLFVNLKFNWEFIVILAESSFTNSVSNLDKIDTDCDNNDDQAKKLLKTTTVKTQQKVSII